MKGSTYLPSQHYDYKRAPHALPLKKKKTKTWILKNEIRVSYLHGKLYQMSHLLTPCNCVCV